MPKGKLYIVASPIGNMGDLTFRALEVLKKIPVILSEDTRETLKLLNHYHTGTKVQISYRDQNHDRVKSEILSLLDGGSDLALISDSGTPLISDPGYKLVRDLIDSGIEIVSLPGPSVLTAGVAISGLPTDKIVFLGFLSKSKNQRKDIIKSYGALDSTLVILESPYRLCKLLTELHEYLGNRKICIVNDLTKKFEKIWRGNVLDLSRDIEGKKLKGEFIVFIAKEGI